MRWMRNRVSIAFIRRSSPSARRKWRGGTRGGGAARKDDAREYGDETRDTFGKHGSGRLDTTFYFLTFVPSNVGWGGSLTIFFVQLIHTAMYHTIPAAI